MTRKPKTRTTVLIIGGLLLLEVSTPLAQANQNCLVRFWDVITGRNRTQSTIQTPKKGTAEYISANRTAHPVTLISDETWANSEKILVNGTDKPLSYSFDGELGWDELFTALKDDPEAMAVMKRNFDKVRYTKEQLLEKLQLSEKQFDSFVVRKGTPLAEQTTWAPTELAPRYFAFLVEGNTSTAVSEMCTTTKTALAKQGLHVDAHPDVGFVELTHPTFDTKPGNFSQTMNTLEKKFPKATMHMHIGIPNDVVSKEEVLAVSRAIESRVILTLAAQPKGSTLAYSQFSSLKSAKEVNDYFLGRGVVRLGFDEFKVAHNFELRQYNKMHDGLDLIRFGSDLAANPSALKKIENFTPKTISDNYTSHLNGALEYTGTLMKLKGTPDLVKKGEELIAFAKQIEEEGTISDKLRVQVMRYLEKNKILQTLDDRSIFLDLP